MSIHLSLLEFRRGILWRLKTLSDTDYQIKVWINHNFIQGAEYDNLWSSYETLVEDTGFEDNEDDDNGSVGCFLYNIEELEAFKKVVGNYKKLFDIYGYKLTDYQYIEKPEWSAVVTSAKSAYDLLSFNDRKFESFENLEHG